MARLLPSGRWQAVDNNGAPASGYKLYTYEPGTSTPKATYTTWDKAVANTNPVILDSRGEATIYWDGTYKIALYTDKDVLVWEEDDYGAGQDSVLTGNYNLIQNGDFEVDEDGDGVPDDWELTSYSGANNALTDVYTYSGGYAFQFSATGNGGGTLTSSRFAVAAGEVIYVSFALVTNLATLDIAVSILWYDLSDTLLSASSIYSNSTTNPTSWTEQSGAGTAPANAKYGRLRLYGIQTAATGTCSFDQVFVTRKVVRAANADNADALGGEPAASFPTSTEVDADITAAVQDLADGVGPEIQFAALAPALVANQSLATAAGYQKLPGGLVIQWGRSTTKTLTTETINFPVAFATACIGVWFVGEYDQEVNDNWKLYNGSLPTTTQFTVLSGNMIPYRWIALGY